MIQCISSNYCIDNLLYTFSFLDIIKPEHLTFLAECLVFSSCLLVLFRTTRGVFSDVAENAETQRLEICITTHLIRIPVTYLIWTSLFVAKKTRSSRAVSVIGLDPILKF